MPNNVFIPELLSVGVTEKLGKAIKLYNIVNVENLGEKTEGDTVKFISTEYIGDAGVVLAGTEIPKADFTDTTKSAPVKKYAKGVIFTEEEIMSGFGDVQGRAENQIAKSVAAGVENALFAELKAIAGAMAHAATKFDVDEIGQALVKFGEDIDDEKYLLVSPVDFANLRKDPNFIVKTNEKVDSVGEIFGCTVVVSGRVAANEAFIVKLDALTVALKQDVKIKVQEEADDDTVLVNGRTHAAVALTDEAGAIKITVTPAP
ncbi:hypothetical protein QT711_03125 [Sporosarcina saromensis]|uniref:Phage major capsid protein, HK97 family n=1 Tax=Sporosarcina saromensis TaxID=359365 RepID=A0ABU4G9A7_9BACL|nr:hypothetical protein [Sporosarcina saromensis]MDW0112162.1 hypothetical protein [Sporosarcina saromensis]